MLWESELFMLIIQKQIFSFQTAASFGSSQIAPLELKAAKIEFYLPNWIFLDMPTEIHPIVEKHVLQKSWIKQGSKYNKEHTKAPSTFLLLYPICETPEWKLIPASFYKTAALGTGPLVRQSCLRAPVVANKLSFGCTDLCFHTLSLYQCIWSRIHLENLEVLEWRHWIRGNVCPKGSQSVIRVSICRARPQSQVLNILQKSYKTT